MAVKVVVVDWKDKSSGPSIKENARLGSHNPTLIGPLRDLTPFEQFLTPANFYNVADVSHLVATGTFFLP
jgi:hypothetical protein